MDKGWPWVPLSLSRGTSYTRTHKAGLPHFHGADIETETQEVQPSTEGHSGWG